MIKANSGAECLAIRIYLDVVDRVECLPDHGLGQSRVKPWSVSNPGGVIDVLTQCAPLQAAAKLQPQFAWRNYCFGTVKQGRGDEAIDPNRALGLIPVAEGLVEKASIQLEIVIEKQLKHSNR